QRDAMVLHLARVRPNRTIPAGRKVLPGKDIITVADQTSAAKTGLVVQADRVFMNAVIHANIELARTYTDMAQEDVTTVYGIGPNPGDTDFNPDRHLPVLQGTEVR